MSKTVAIYVRVSTGKQADRDSIPFQIQECSNYVKHFLKTENFEVFKDAGRSGKNTHRPEYQRMIEKVKAGMISHVVVYKIDRISRNLVDFSIMYNDFKEHKVAFISLNEQFDTSSAIGEAVLKIILVFAELERKLTGERVRDIMMNRALEGKWNGARVPYGWDWDTKKQCPVHSDTEAEYARMMYRLYDECHSTCVVRDYCNAHDIPTKRGGEWTSKTVADFLRNPMNVGDYRYNYRKSARGKRNDPSEVIYVKDVFPPLIDRELYERVTHQMGLNTFGLGKDGRKVVSKKTHVFGGLVVCGLCGAFYHSDADVVRADGFRPSNYRCGAHNKKIHCKAKGTSDVKLGPFIFNYISNLVKASKSKKLLHFVSDLEQILLTGPEFEQVAGIADIGLDVTFDTIMHGFKPKRYTAAPYTVIRSGDSDALTAKRDKTIRALERLKKLFLFEDDAMSEKEYLMSKRELEGTLSDIENELSALEADTADTKYDDMSFISTASGFLIAHQIASGEHINYRELSCAVDAKVLKDFVNSVIERIVLLDGRVASIEFKNGLVHEFLYRE